MADNRPTEEATPAENPELPAEPQSSPTAATPLTLESLAAVVAELQRQIATTQSITDQAVGTLNSQVHQAQAQATSATQGAMQAAQVATQQQSTGRSAVRIPHPQRFKGVRDGPKVLEWAHQATTYLRAAGLEFSEQGVWHITSFLDGDASVWWRLYCDKMERGLAARPARWSDFKALIVDQFQVFNHITDVRDRYQALKQTDAVSAYITRFRSLVVELPDEPEEHQIYQFLKGLKPEIQARTRTHKPATLAIAMDIADEADRANMHAHRHRSSTIPPTTHRKHASSFYPRIGNGHRGAVEPMQLGAISTSTRRPRKELTELQKDQLRRDNKCFQCGKVGHRARDCSKKKKQQRRGYNDRSSRRQPEN